MTHPYPQPTLNPTHHHPNLTHPTSTLTYPHRTSTTPTHVTHQVHIPIPPQHIYPHTISPTTNLLHSNPTLSYPTMFYPANPTPILTWSTRPANFNRELLTQHSPHSTRIHLSFKLSWTHSHPPLHALKCSNPSSQLPPCPTHLVPTILLPIPNSTNPTPTTTPNPPYPPPILTYPSPPSIST